MEIREPPIGVNSAPGTPVYFVTLIAGLESIAAEELAEKLPAAQVLGALRGKLLFASPHPPERGLSLLTVENLFAYVDQLEGIPASRDGLAVMERRLAETDLEGAIAVYRRLHGRPATPSFRVTAKRAGSHDYNSLEIAAAAGAGVVRRYGWTVDLKGYDYDVRVYLTDDSALVGLRLSGQPLHERSRVRHGAASLNPTVAHAMCRLSRPTAGQVVIDPMCGVGTILVERARLPGEAMLVGGDLFEEPLKAACENLTAAGVSGHLVQWDARRLALRDGCADTVICNLPWGRRIGSHRVNRNLYPGFVRELVRILRPGGTAVLLTQEKRLLSRLVGRSGRLEMVRQYHLSLSGIHPAIYVLSRSAQ